MMDLKNHTERLYSSLKVNIHKSHYCGDCNSNTMFKVQQFKVHNTTVTMVTQLVMCISHITMCSNTKVMY